MAGSTNSIVARNVLKGRLSENNLMAGAVGTAYNPTYAIVTEAGAQIVLYINSSNYQFYAELKDKYGNHISNSNIIDLPLESMVVDGSYDVETKEVVLVLDNGNEVRFSVADLVEGLVSTEQLNTILGNYVKFTDYATSSKGGVIKISDTYATAAASGVLTSQTKTYEQYNSLNNDAFVGKGTLENVITGKELTNKEYVDAADKIFENDLFGDEIVSDNGENITLNNTTDAPMEIELKGNTYQYSTSGKNLANINVITDLTTQDAVVHRRIVNDTIILSDNTNSTGYASTEKKLSEICPNLQEGDTAYLFFNTTSNVTNKNLIYIGETWTKGTSKVITQTMLNKTVILYGGYNETATISNFMITKVNDSTYEPYTNGASPNPDYPQDIQVVSGDNEIKVEGKNLFSDSLELGSLGSSGQNISSSADLRNVNYIYVKPNTQYTISIPYNTRIAIRCYDENKIFKTSVSTSNSPKTFTTPADCYYMRFSFLDQTNTSLNIMLEKGNQATEYTPYVSQSYPISLGDIELCKMGDYQDRIYKDSGKWYLHKEIGKVVLNGSEDWGLANNVFYKANNKGLQQSEIKIVKSNYFGEAYNQASTNNVNKYNPQNSICGAASSTNRIYIKTNIASTTEDFKTWLSTHNTTVYYVLETPTYTEITDATLLSQLNALENVRSYQEQTNISQNNNDMPFEIAATAFVDSTAGKLAATAAQINTLNETDDDLSANKEDKSNKVATISASSTDTEYPTAKCVYDLVGDVESLLEALDIGSGV